MFSGVGTTPALARRERRLRLVRLAEVVAASGAITALIAGTASFDEFGPGALVTAIGGLAVLVAASLAAQRLRRTVRYRIDRPYSTAWLVGKITALVAGLIGAAAIASAVDAPSLSRPVIVLVVVGALMGVVNAHAARWMLFQIDATGLKLGRATVPWPAVASLDLASAAPGTVEIGVRLAPGQTVGGSPVPGTVLADLPVCTVVPAVAVDVERVRWAVREFGNPAIPVVIRQQATHPSTPTPASPAAPYFAAMPAPPPFPYAAGPKRRRGWMIGGALALAAVLIAGVVTAVVLTSDDDPAQPDPAQPGTAAEREPRYSSARVEEPCDLIDVDVLKRLQTVPEIATEPGREKQRDYEWLHCTARNGAEHSVGRVTTFVMMLVVAESDDVARDYYAEEEDEQLWDASGDELEQGKVDLGELAEFAQAISTNSSDTTHTEYVLRVRDDNLALFLRFTSDGPGSTSGSLADTAYSQASRAMEKLRTRPAENGSEPASVPKAMHEAVTLPSTADLMNRIRAADACELHDREAASTFGKVEVEPHQALGLAECRLMATSGDSRVGLRIQLNGYLSEEERADLGREEINGQEVFHSKADPASNSCTYHVPYGNTGFGAEVSVIKYVPGAEDQASWPEACEAAREYTAHVAPRLAELPARSQPAPEPTLVGKDPCVADDVARALLPGWKLGPISRYHSAQCQFTMTQGEDNLQFTVDFDRDAEQLGDEPATVGGLTGVWFNQYEGQCGLSLVYLPESAPDAEDAHNIGASIQNTNSYGTTSPVNLCELTEKTATILIERAS